VDGLFIEAVDEAISKAKQDPRPSMIVCKTTIGFGSPNKAGSNKSHGAALGPEEVKLTKEALGLDPDADFQIPQEALAYWRRSILLGEQFEAEWQSRLNAYRSTFPEKGLAFGRVVRGELPEGWQNHVPSLGEKMATRAASGKVLNALAPYLATLVGGSADLAESNNTMLHEYEHFQADAPTGRNLWFGVREHAMATAVNGINLHGGMRAYGGTFLIFSDYCRPAIRLAALMECPSIFVMTHDSIGLGEDGPTHQPIEHLMSLRAIPNLNVMRPCDGNETAACWILALERTDGPSLLALTRQGLPPVSSEDVRKHPARRGAYVLAEASSGAPQRILVATGSEVALTLSAREILEAAGMPTRVVSMPSWFLFERQDPAYRDSVFPSGILTVSVEAGATLGWARYAQRQVGLDHFGASAPGDVLFREFGFTAESVAEVARAPK
jgi:transketolase